MYSNIHTSMFYKHILPILSNEFTWALPFVTTISCIKYNISVKYRVSPDTFTLRLNAVRIFSETCWNTFLALCTEAFFEPSPTSLMKGFCKNTWRLLAVNYFRKNPPSQMFGWVLKRLLYIAFKFSAMTSLLVTPSNAENLSWRAFE